MSRFPLPDTRLPALGPLLAGQLWNHWSDQKRVFECDEVRKAIQYVRLKPGVSCRLTIFNSLLGIGDEPPQGFILHLFPDAERAEMLYEKVIGKRHIIIGQDGYEPFLSTKPPAVVIPFPNDPEIPELRHIYRPKRFASMLRQVLPEYSEEEWRFQRRNLKTTLLAYKPGRRGVIRVKAKLRHKDHDQKIRVRLHTKLETPRTVEHSYENLCALYDAIGDHPEIRIPKPQGFLEDKSFVACEWIEAPSLSKLLEQQPPDLEQILCNTGRSLSAFHELEVPLDHLPSPMEEAVALRSLAEDIEGLVPTETQRVRAMAKTLGQQLSRLALAPSAIIHADFHPGQVIVRNQCPVFVDFDGAGRGYAVQDVGSFLAYLEEQGAPTPYTELFLAGYRDGHRNEIPLDLVKVTKAVTLFRRAMVPFRELRDDWPQRVRRQLDLVEKELAGVRS